MPNRNNNTKRRNTNNSIRTNNSTTRRRRGAITPNNAKRIRGTFQRPPPHPRKPTYTPRSTPSQPSRPLTRSLANLANINIGNLSVAEMDALLLELA
jgi:hypothetical protein